MSNIVNAMNNLSRVPNWQAILTLKEVDYWLTNYSDTVFCNGRLRQVVFEPITPNSYKVYSRSI